jgi:NitT/TauT family transport system permease protein
MPEDSVRLTAIGETVVAPQTKGEHVRTWLPPVLTLLALCVLWQVLAATSGLPVWMVPTPVAVIAAGAEFWTYLPYNTLVTLYETISGFAVAAVLGVATAVLISASSFVRSTIYPILITFQSLPKIAIAPLLLMWVGHGDLPKIIIVFLVCYFPIVVSTVSGLDAVPGPMLELARAVSASRLQLYMKFRLPCSLPYIFVGLKVSVTLAISGAVIGEFVGASAGLGYIIIMSSQQFNTALAFCAMALLTLLTIGLYYVVDMLERLTIPWARLSA